MAAIQAAALSPCVQESRIYSAEEGCGFLSNKTVDGAIARRVAKEKIFLVLVRDNPEPQTRNKNKITNFY